MFSKLDFRKYENYFCKFSTKMLFLIIKQMTNLLIFFFTFFFACFYQNYEQRKCWKLVNIKTSIRKIGQNLITKLSF